MAETTDTAPAPAVAPVPAPNGFAGVWNFLDGVGGTADRIGGIVETGSGIAEDVARGKAAITTQRQDRQERQLGMALRMRGFERGDNKLTIIAVACAAVAVIILMNN